MNKFFTKISALLFGLTLTVGAFAVVSNLKDPVRVLAESEKHTLVFKTADTTDPAEPPAGNNMDDIASSGGDYYSNYYYDKVKFPGVGGVLLGQDADHGGRLTLYFKENCVPSYFVVNARLYDPNEASIVRIVTTNAGISQNLNPQRVGETSKDFIFKTLDKETHYYSLYSGARIWVSSIQVIFGELEIEHTLTYEVGEHGTYDGTTTKQFSLVENTGTHQVLGLSDLGMTAEAGYDFVGWTDGTKDYAVGSTFTMGTDDVTLTAKWAPTPTPAPTPVVPSNNGGLGVGGIIGIVAGSVVLALGIAYLLLFFIFNRWIVVDGKAVRVFMFFKKGDKNRVISYSFKVFEKEPTEVFKTKQEALNQ